MNTNHEVISAFLDDEPFEPQALAEALADPAGRELLIDFVLLRHVAESEESASVVTPTPALRSKRPVYLAAAAAVLVALLGGYQLGQRQLTDDSPRPPQRRASCNPNPSAGSERCEMKTLIASAIIPLAFAAAARAQTDGVERLSIMVQGAAISLPGGEELRVGGSANPNEPGKTVRHGFSVLPDGCNWSVSRVVEAAADLGWAVEITPVRVVGDAVTFRLVWARTRDEGKASTQSRNDMELTLRPGESIPLDSVLRPCPGEPRRIGASLRVTVSGPHPDYDRRLIALDLWLVESLKMYRAEPAVVPARSVSPADFLLFRLDYAGRDGARHLRRSHGGFGRSHKRREDHDAQPDLRSESASGQAVPAGDHRDNQNLAERSRSVQLPKVAEASAFASRALSFRIRVRQLR